MTFVAEAAGILYRHRYVCAETLEQAEVGVREGVKLAMRRGKDADQVIFNQERNGYFRLDVRLACFVVRIASNIWGVTHLASGGDVSHNAFGADFEAMSLAMDGAA